MFTRVVPSVGGRQSDVAFTRRPTGCVSIQTRPFRPPTVPNPVVAPIAPPHPHDVFGHHRSACAVSGVLGGRGDALESGRQGVS